MIRFRLETYGNHCCPKSEIFWLNGEGKKENWNVLKKG